MIGVDEAVLGRDAPGVQLDSFWSALRVVEHEFKVAALDIDVNLAFGVDNKLYPVLLKNRSCSLQKLASLQKIPNSVVEVTVPTLDGF